MVTNAKQKNHIREEGAILAQVVKVGLSENVAFEQQSEWSDKKSHMDPQESAFQAKGTTKV